MKVALFRLGEAGSLISADLVAADVTVIGYDPDSVMTRATVETLRRVPTEGVPTHP